MRGYRVANQNLETRRQETVCWILGRRVTTRDTADCIFDWRLKMVSVIAVLVVFSAMPALGIFVRLTSDKVDSRKNLERLVGAF